MANLFFYYAAMNAGKSTALLQAAYNYKELGMSALLFTPSIDTRYGEGRITSRSGLYETAHVISPDLDVYEYVRKAKHDDPKLACVLVDEVHFLKKHHVLQFARIVDDLGIPVLAYGLRSDFRGEPFEATGYLLAIADKVSEIKTVCHCGRKATMNMRVGADGKKAVDGPQIQIGGNDVYVATCRAHYFKGESGR